ncbi:MAG: hypothetical protein ACJ8CR_07840 [Roseiflexaceae bacterium]
MKMTMIPGLCSNEYQPTGGSFCESCFARFLMQRSEPDLPCISDVQDDGAEEQTLIFQYGSYQQAVLLTDEERERLAYGDWKGWTEFVEQVTSMVPSPD